MSRLLTDHELVDACSAARLRAFEDAGRRTYTAHFRTGSGPMESIVTRTFAVGHAEAARTYAREYAARILTDARVISVRWTR